MINTCDVYTVQKNDTCITIFKSQNITEAQSKAWKPSLDFSCYNLNGIVDDQLCVSKPGTASTLPSSITALGPITATNAATVPTDLAVETNTNCGKYYTAVSGDYCHLITLKFDISLGDFLFLNTVVNSDCTNLYAEESSCVGGSGGYQHVQRHARVRDLHGDHHDFGQRLGHDLAHNRLHQTYPTATSLPLASGTRDDCWQYFNGTNYIGKATGSSLFTSDCDFAAQVFGISLEDLGI